MKVSGLVIQDICMVPFASSSLPVPALCIYWLTGRPVTLELRHPALLVHMLYNILSTQTFRSYMSAVLKQDPCPLQCMYLKG